jgi:FlaA1/EpsC-like NDP-sugar epimerase
VTEFKDANVLVVGGAGFVGSNVVKKHTFNESRPGCGRRQSLVS